MDGEQGQARDEAHLRDVKTYSFPNRERGTIEAEVTVARFGGDHFYMMFAAFSERKVFDWLLDQGKVKTKKVKFNEFMNA